MMKWPVLKLEEITEIISGATPSTSESSFWDGEISWVTPKDLSNLDGPYISDTPRTITRKGLVSCAATVLPPDSVLFSSRAPIGHVAINTIPMATNQGFKSFIPNRDLLFAKFLYHWLRWNRPYLESLGNGATFKEVSKAIVSRIEIPLPPLPEQQRIAKILDHADALRAKRRAALEHLETLTQSIFLEMFGDPVTNSKSWEKKQLVDITKKITDGEHLNPEFSSVGMPIVMAGNVLDNAIDLRNTKKVEPALGERFRKKCGPDKGDLLLVSRGATIGRLCSVDVPDRFCLMGSVILIKPDIAVLDNKYLTVLLKHPMMRATLYKTSGSSAQQAIYLKDLKQMTCPLPPLELQHTFARRVAVIEKLKSIHVAALSGLNVLFLGLQHRAFRGEL
jgi:type I restriction enzyme, S subunit